MAEYISNEEILLQTHKGARLNEDGKLFLPINRDHPHLDNKEVAPLLRAGYELSSMWERFIFNAAVENWTTTGNWTGVAVGLHGSNSDAVQYKGITYSVVFAVASNKVGVLKLRWTRIPTDIATATGSIVGRIGHDYKRNIRDRSIPFATASAPVVIEREYRFPGFRLQPDTDIDLWYSIGTGSPGKMSVTVTGHIREFQRGS